MRTLIGIGFAAIGFLLGGLAGGELADLGANHRGDIGRIALGGLLVGLMGATAAGFAGRALANRLAARPRMLKGLVLATWLAPIVAVAIGATYVQFVDSLRRSDNIRPDGSGLALNFNIRIPAGLAAPGNARDIRIELQTPDETQEAASKAVTVDDGRVVIVGHFWVHKATAKRVVAFSLPDGPTHYFTMHMASRPASGFRWSSWSGPDAGSANAQAGSVSPLDRFEIRYSANY